MGPRRWWMAAVHVGAYFVATIGWVALLGVGLVALAFANPALFGQVSLDGLSSGAAPELTAVVSWFTVVQLGGMAAIGAIGALFVPSGGRVGLARVRVNLGFVTPRLVAVLLAAIIGLVGGLFPSWVIEQLRDRLPGFAPLVDALVSAALSGPLMNRVAIGVAVAVAAPWFEEIAFRGYLWSAVERYTSPLAAFVVTSLVFTLFHLDPAQMLGVLPIAFTLGWARWWSGSIWPPIALHTVNNALALVLAAAGPDVAQASTPLWVGLGGLAVTLACVAGLVVVGRRGPAPM